MATTKQVLRLQSDQTLDDAQLATRVRLKDLTATRAIQLIWIEPAASDWNITFKDPGADDAIVYENLAQSLSNKTLGTPTITDFTNAQHDHSAAAQGGSVDHSNIANPDATDDHTQYSRLAGRAGGQVLIGGTAPNEDLSLQSTANATRGDIIAIDDILMGSGKEVTGLPVTPSGPTAAASKAYVDSAIAGGQTWKEVLLSSAQLDSVSDGISPAGVFYLTATAQIGDTFILNDGGTTETWTFAGVSAPNQPAIGASALDSMTDLVSRITIDSTAWNALLVTGALQGINSGSGDAVVVYRKVPTSGPTDRVYGVFAAPATAQIVDFGGQDDYSSSISINLPAADPSTANFGLGRVTAGLVPNESHIVRAEDETYTWNEDAGNWQLGGGVVAFATSGAGGAVVGKLTADSDKGLLITGGPGNAILETKVDGVSVTHNVSGELVAIGAVTEFYLDDPVAGQLAGTVFADWDYPSFATDFEQFWKTSSTAAAGVVHTSFTGKLSTTQTTIDQIALNIKGVNLGTVTYDVKVYADGSGAVPVFSTGVTVPPASSTPVVIPGGSLSSQPAGQKRFFVVVEAATMAAGESVSLSKPFVRVS